MAIKDYIDSKFIVDFKSCSSLHVDTVSITCILHLSVTHRPSLCHEHTTQQDIYTLLMDFETNNVGLF